MILKFTNRIDSSVFVLFVCYLPPDGSTRTVDADAFVNELMKKVYEYQSEGEIILCGDFNARLGSEPDYIEGVDIVKPREIIDESTNSYCDILSDFLIDCNLCMLNGRLGENNFTHVSTRGKSVVDYVFVPHEQFQNFCDFSVRSMSDVINDFDLQGFKSSDHSILLWTKRTSPIFTSKTAESAKSSPQNEKKFLIDNIPASFLNCENSLVLIADCINRIETHLNQDKNVSDAYTCFVKLIVSEMQSKLKCIQIGQGKGKTHKSRSKPFWNTELQDMWNKVYSSEKQWLKFKGSTVTKNRLRQEYCYVRNAFDKLLRKAKRNYQLSEQQSLRDKLFNTENPREFWTEIGKIGMANDRKSRIPFEVSDQDGIKTDRDSVLGKWKSDYEHLYNNGQTDVFDDEHLQRVKELLNNPDTPEFPKSDCSSLNCPITYEEVRKAVYEAKLRKASGIDGIPAEVLRNETCIDLLFKIVSYAFANDKVPSEWSKGIIKPLPKGDDPRNPLNYRPITIISIPCKIYANILNKRLLLWLEGNGLIADEQNGFRKNRSCQDHVYALYSLIHNRKLRKKETYTCFVDCRKAFDTVNRDCLWFKLMSFGIHGKILQAIQSLYVNVSCAVKVNEHFTDFFPVKQGLKQGCGLSPALFSIYINDLAAEINALHCGIKFDNNEVSILLYADDVVLISESEDDLQNMLNTLNNWCNKWRLAVNESKTKIVHLRNKNQLRSNFIFQCGEKVITFEHEYKYLGFWFNEYLDLELVAHLVRYI